MNKRLNKHGIIRFWLIQFGLVLALTLIGAVKFTINAGYSALLGGLVAIIPNAFFARNVFKYQGAHAAKKIVNSFYKGEALKIILSIILFTIVFNFCKITPLAFFASYVLILMTHWLSPWIIINKRK